tara:strand:- start:298 stop:435 length:138 start_codon:yes stop_codon:yes gene_type:complete
VDNSGSHLIAKVFFAMSARWKNDSGIAGDTSVASLEARLTTLEAR